MQGRELLEVESVRNLDSDSFVLRWYSPALRIRGGVTLRHDWLEDFDTGLRELRDFLQTDIVRLLEGVDRSPIMPDPQRLQAEIQRQVIRKMEEIERRHRAALQYRRLQEHLRSGLEGIFENVYRDALLYGVGIGGALVWPPVKEDPEASKRARELLLRHLDERQRKDYEELKQFKVQVAEIRINKDCRYGGEFLISHASSFNVTGPNGIKYCCQTPGVPIEDQLLAQKLLLEHDPARFFANANTMGGPRASFSSRMGYAGQRGIFGAWNT